MSLIKISSQMLDEYRIDAKAGIAINAAIGVITALFKKRPVPESKFRKMVNTLIKNYDEYPVAMNSLGIALSIYFLLDSNNDRKEERKFQDRVIDTFRNYPPNLWEQRLAEIRTDVESLKSRQLTMGAIKLFMSASFGYYAYAGTLSTLGRTVTALYSVASGTAALINGVNYYNLHELVRRLQRDGRLN
ncbi:unnamed protein product [Adineta ricciae]|nr:unnamed protein product [Adineta ricciae]